MATETNQDPSTVIERPWHLFALWSGYALLIFAFLRSWGSGLTSLLICLAGIALGIHLLVAHWGDSNKPDADFIDVINLIMLVLCATGAIASLFTLSN